MSFNKVSLNPGAGGADILVDTIAGADIQIVKFAVGAEGASTLVSTADPMPVQQIGTPALPTNAATEGKQDVGNTSLDSIDTKLNSLATEATLDAAKTLLISIDGNVLGIRQEQATAGKQDIGNAFLDSINALLTSPSLPTGAASETTLAALLAKVIAAPSTEAKQDALNTLITTLNGLVATESTQVAMSAKLPASLGAKTTANSMAVNIASDQTVPVKEIRAATPSQTSPAPTNSNTSILASNSNRLGGTIYNEGSAICYMKLGSTASTTSYTLQIQVGGYYEIPFGYTGAIDGITGAGTAQLRVTELT